MTFGVNYYCCTKWNGIGKQNLEQLCSYWWADVCLFIVFILKFRQRWVVAISYPQHNMCWTLPGEYFGLQKYYIDSFPSKSSCCIRSSRATTNNKDCTTAWYLVWYRHGEFRVGELKLRGIKKTKWCKNYPKFSEIMSITRKRLTLVCSSTTHPLFRLRSLRPLASVGDAF